MPARRFIALVLLVLLAAQGGCTAKKWNTQQVSPEEFMAQERPDRIRVTTNGGEQLDLRSPHVVQDSIAGSYRGETRCVALEDVTRIETRGVNWVVTGVVWGLVVVGTVATIAAAGSWNMNMSWN